MHSSKLFLTFLLTLIVAQGSAQAKTTPPGKQTPINLTTNDQALTLDSFLKPVDKDDQFVAPVNYTFKGTVADSINTIRLCSATDNTCTACTTSFALITAGTTIPYSTIGKRYGILQTAIAMYLQKEGLPAGSYNIGMYVQSTNKNCIGSSTTTFCTTSVDTSGHNLCMQATYSGTTVTALAQSDNGIANLIKTPTSLYDYVTDETSNLWQCTLDNTTGGIATTNGCIQLTNTTGPGFFSTQGVTIGTFTGSSGPTPYLYVSDFSSTLWQCPIGSTGQIAGGACSAQTTSFLRSNSVTFATFGVNNYGYVSDNSSNLWQCTMNSNGGINSCSALTTFTSTQSVTFATFNGIIYAYVADKAVNGSSVPSVRKCPVNTSTGQITSSTCVLQPISITAGPIEGVTFGTFGPTPTTFAYVADGGQNIWLCTVNTTTGNFTTCTITNVNSFVSTVQTTFAVFPSIGPTLGNTYAYVADVNQPTPILYQCLITPGGSTAGSFDGFCSQFTTTPSPASFGAGAFGAFGSQ